MANNKRFKVLDGETNTPVMDFFNTVDSQIVNKDRTNAKLSILDLTNINNTVSNGNIPDSYKLASVLNSGDSVLKGANNVTRDSLIDLLAVSPAYADIMRKVGYGHGTSQLKLAIPQLLKQIANNDVLSKFAGNVRQYTSKINLNGSGIHLPDFTGVFSGVPGIGDKLDALKKYAKLPTLSTDTLEALHRITRNPALQSAIEGAGMAALSGITIGRLQSLLFPSRTPAASLVANLPPVLKERVLVNVSDPNKPNTYIPNPNGPVTILPNNPDAGLFIGEVNKLVPGAVSIPVTLPETNAKLITTIVAIGVELGVTNIFTSISNTINDPIATVAAGAVTANSAAINGDLNVIFDISNSPYAATIGALLPNLAADVIGSLKIPTEITHAELLALSTKLIHTLDIMTPNWRTITFNDVNRLTISEMNLVNLLAPANNSNTTSEITKVLDIKSKALPLVIPDLISTPGNQIPTVANIDQWTLWGSTYSLTTVKEAVKLLIPIPPFTLA